MTMRRKGAYVHNRYHENLRLITTNSEIPFSGAWWRHQLLTLAIFSWSFFYWKKNKKCGSMAQGTTDNTPYWPSTMITFALRGFRGFPIGMQILKRNEVVCDLAISCCGFVAWLVVFISFELYSHAVINIFADHLHNCLLFAVLEGPHVFFSFPKCCAQLPSFTLLRNVNKINERNQFFFPNDFLCWLVVDKWVDVDRFHNMW